MPKPVSFLTAALAEAEATAAWYAERDPQVADAFLNELDRAVAAVSRTPATWPLYLHGTRRYRLRRFPLALVFQADGATIVVVAVAHERRKPGYWQGRGGG